MASIVEEKSLISVVFETLRDTKFGDDVQDPARFRMKPRVLTTLISNLAMLLENGLSLPKALATLSEEQSLKKYRWMLNQIRRGLENGVTFSGCLAQFPRTFNRVIVGQVEVGEKSGRMVETLQRISTQFERNGEVRKTIMKRLSYPAMIMLAGAGLVVFMMTVVVPEFEAVFQQSGAALPWITQFVSNSSKFCFNWGWLVLLQIIVLTVAFRQFRKRPEFAEATDRLALKTPIVGRWVRDYAVLQFIDTAGVMMDAGFVPVEAIESSVSSVKNQAVRKVVNGLAIALRRGERLSTELARHPNMFPPTVSQLVIIGEQTGNLSKATSGVRNHLRDQLESRIDSAVTMIEPILTLALAVLIGCIVMAIYMPMFGMLEAME